MTSFKNRLVALRKLFGKRSFLAAFIASTAILALAYSITANFFILGSVEPNPFASLLTELLVLFMAVGGGILAASWLYRRSMKANTCAAGVTGGSIGLLTSACSYCPPLAAYFLGAQSLFFLSKSGAVLAAASVALVYYGVYSSLDLEVGE